VSLTLWRWSMGFGFLVWVQKPKALGNDNYRWGGVQAPMDPEEKDVWLVILPDFQQFPVASTREGFHEPSLTSASGDHQPLGLCFWISSSRTSRTLKPGLGLMISSAAVSESRRWCSTNPRARQLALFHMVTGILPEKSSFLSCKGAVSFGQRCLYPIDKVLGRDTGKPSVQ
jgi:hypothetical protein